MAFNKISFWSLCLAPTIVLSHVTTGRRAHGLLGYGIQMYKPSCAYACRDTISGSALNCSTYDEMAGMEHGGMDMGGMSEATTSPECYATDDAFLQTMAWCIKTHCENVEAWRIERYWTLNIAGIQPNQPLPKESYAEALAKVKTAPTDILTSGDPLNKTSLVRDEDYIPNLNADIIFPRMEYTHEKYGLIVFLSGVVIPIALSLLRFIPFPATLITKFYAHVIHPPIWGSKHRDPVLGFAHLPTRGQALFVAYLVVINVVLSAVGFESRYPNSWYGSKSAEIANYIANRAGILSFANLPLLILYAGRNNLLLQLTNWSHDTFLLLHRWVAWICTIQACLHSAMYLQDYLASDGFKTEVKEAYWIWGIVATLGMSILLPTSVYPLRRKFYEIFLAWHVVIAVFVVVGCYLHIIERFSYQWGYETWILVAIAIWSFDRLLRLLKLGQHGLKHATVSVIDDDYIRLEIDRVHCRGHAYLYFPTLTWRIWENHPFSVAGTTLLSEKPAALCKDKVHLDLEKNAAVESDTSSGRSNQDNSQRTKVGATFLLRTQDGLTSRLRSATLVPVLIEASYGHHEDLSEHPLLICIAGGVGITAVLPYLQSHPGQRKLFWGARSNKLIESMQDALIGVESENFVEKRMKITDILNQEIRDTTDSVAVVVCGPAEMADEARFVINRLGQQRKGIKLRFIEEAFSW